MNSSAILMLDLGNVVFPLEFEAFDAWLLTCRRDQQRDISKDFLAIYLDYERGKFDTSFYYRRMREELELDFEESKFEKMWLSCWQKDTEGMEDFIVSLKGKYKLCVLSNTNALHMNDYLKTKKILGHFDQLFLSYEMGCSKPDVAIYKKITQELQVKPEQILFFDDKAENIEGARKAGWQAEIFNGVKKAKLRFEQHVKQVETLTKV